MNKMKAYLTLIGDEFNFEDVSKQIGMSADSTRSPSEILKNGHRFGHTEWGIETEQEEREELEPLLRKLFARLPCSPQRLFEIAQKCCAEWHILIWLTTYGNECPILCFPVDIIQFMAEIHAQMGFDNYIFPEKDKGVELLSPPESD